MIETNVRLTELDLSDNALGPVGVEGIKEFLRSPSSFMLQTLKLNNDGLGGGGVVGFLSFAYSIKNNFCGIA